jgi:hypothetical protein
LCVWRVFDRLFGLVDHSFQHWQAHLLCRQPRRDRVRAT